MLLISAAFLFTSCSQKQGEGKVPFIDREVDVLSFLEGFPYSTWGFYLSDDASKLIYVRNTDGNPLLLLDLAESTPSRCLIRLPTTFSTSIPFPLRTV